MIYLIFPAMIASMLGYMFWRASMNMRRDRVRSQREAGRRRFRLRRKDRSS